MNNDIIKVFEKLVCDDDEIIVCHSEETSHSFIKALKVIELSLYKINVHTKNKERLLIVSRPDKCTDTTRDKIYDEMYMELYKLMFKYYRDVYKD